MSVYRTSGPLVCFKCYTCTESKTVQSKQLIAKHWPIVQQENVDAKQQFAGNYCSYIFETEAL